MTRVFTALLVAAAIAFTACSGDDDDTPSSTPLPSTPVATSPSAGTESPSPELATKTPPAKLTFEQFAEQIDESVANQSTDLFLVNPILTEIDCPNELFGDCGAGPKPTIIQGIFVGNWRSEGFPASPEEFQSQLGDYLAKGPSLYAIAVKNEEGEDLTPAYYAITSVGGDPQGTAYFVFKEDSGEHRLQAMIFAPVLGEEWTSGDCAECYDSWQLW